LETLRQLGAKVGPYLILEILLPGGSILALLLFLYQRRASMSDVPRASFALGPKWTLSTLVSAARAALELLWRGQPNRFVAAGVTSRRKSDGSSPPC
jgi:hypothetical protein